uniref:Bm7023, isoform b n=1 Tax=Brugia malayi TaxID=6279 RepID=A0A1I9G4E6_BRUMA|nr:Bm7023, isoform b [Brugia malayi]
MILSTALLAILFVRKTAEQRQLMPTIRIPSIISLNPRSPINRKSTIQSQQPGLKKKN